MLVVVAAVARNGVIGGDNRLLWRLKSDLARFKALTLGKPLLMGRRTFQSIGRPLPGRETVVVSRDPAFSPSGVHMVPDIESGLDLAARRAEAMGAREIVVAGGGEIYAQLLDRADRLHITEVDLAPAGNARFPPIDPARWRETGREPHESGPGDESRFSFVDYVRRDTEPRPIEIGASGA
jgi:dihydrofolate reductase